MLAINVPTNSYDIVRMLSVCHSNRCQQTHTNATIVRIAADDRFHMPRHAATALDCVRPHTRDIAVLSSACIHTIQNRRTTHDPIHAYTLAYDDGATDVHNSFLCTHKNCTHPHNAQVRRLHKHIARADTNALTR